MIDVEQVLSDLKAALKEKYAARFTSDHRPLGAVEAMELYLRVLVNDTPLPKPMAISKPEQERIDVIDGEKYAALQCHLNDDVLLESMCALLPLEHCRRLRDAISSIVQETERETCRRALNQRTQRETMDYLRRLSS